MVKEYYGKKLIDKFNHRDTPNTSKKDIKNHIDILVVYLIIKITYQE